MQPMKNIYSALFKNLNAFWAISLIWIFLPSFTHGQQSDKKRHGQGVASGIPTIIASQTNYTYNQGEVAVLYCTVQNLGENTVVWSKADRPHPLTIGTLTFVPDTRIETHHVERKDQWNLHIRNASKKDEGVYVCQVATADQSVQKNFLLTINDDQQDINLSGNLIVEKADTLELTCNASSGSHPLNSIDWFKDGNSIMSDDQRKVQITLSYPFEQTTIQSTLRIEEVQLSDAGTYLCRASDLLVANKTVRVLNIPGTSNGYVGNGRKLT